MAAKEFADPLILTTPHLTGQRVKDAQYLLAGHNRFPGLGTYKDGVVDGDYGPLSAQATRSAKYWLGYPNAGLDGAFGQTLYEYLRTENWRPLPASYRKRRDQRIEAAAKTPGEIALGYAIGQVGYKEDPAGSNDTKYGLWYGFNGVPWCAIFESYCFDHSGYARYRYAAVEVIYADAVNNRNNLKIVRSPVAGDVALYSLGGDRYAHTGFFEKWVDQPHGEFGDLGGNTGPVNVSNGGEVARGTRTVNEVLAFVRVG
jgi:hypothetical protein